jgi:hypothetical protein
VITAIKEAERRMVEAKIVNVATYGELESVMGEAYRELKLNLATVGYQLLKTQEELEKSKANAILDKYPDFLVGKPAKFDNATTRDAFLIRDVEYMEARERHDSLTALNIFLDGKVRVIENVCRYMRKLIDLERSNIGGKMPYER